MEELLYWHLDTARLWLKEHTEWYEEQRTYILTDCWALFIVDGFIDSIKKRHNKCKNKQDGL